MLRISQITSNAGAISPVIPLIMSIGLLGCNTIPDYSSPYTTPRVGSTIQLNQELSARNGVRIYLQDGYVLTWQELEKQEPYCQFYVARSSADLRSRLTIEPDTFVVNRVFRRKDVSGLQSAPLDLTGENWVATANAQLAAFGEGDFENNRGSSQRTMSTYLELSSATQPNVKRMICSQWADPAMRYHVSVEEIIRSLGDIAQFNLAR